MLVNMISVMIGSNPTGTMTTVNLPHTAWDGRPLMMHTDSSIIHHAHFMATFSMSRFLIFDYGSYNSTSPRIGDP